MIKKNTEINKAKARHNLFVIAFKHLPGGYLATGIGVASLSAPLLYNFFREHGIDTFFPAALLTGAIIVVAPFILLYLVTLLRSTKIRDRLEIDAKLELEIISEDMDALVEKERKDEEQVNRLAKVVQDDIDERKVKDERDDKRWNMLNEQIRIQEETTDLQSKERLVVAKQVKDIKDEGEIALTKYTTDDVKARDDKAQRDEDHWKALDERMRIQEEKLEEREIKQDEREEELLKIKQAEAVTLK